LQGDPNVAIKTGPGTNVIYMVFNPAHGPVDKLEVRRAIAHAIDYEGIVEFLFDGNADIVAGQPHIWNSEVVHEGLPKFAYDPQRARQLLQQTGAVGAGLV